MKLNTLIYLIWTFVLNRIYMKVNIITATTLKKIMQRRARKGSIRQKTCVKLKFPKNSSWAGFRNFIPFLKRFCDDDNDSDDGDESYSYIIKSTYVLKVVLRNWLVKYISQVK